MHGRPSTRIMSFNSRPAKGATLRQRVLQRKTVPVSIHAPVKGATAGLMADRKLGDKFQFTPPRRGRRATVSVASTCPSFNSRPREGGDRRRNLRPHRARSRFNSRPREGGDDDGFHAAALGIDVSIHAPAKGGDMDAGRGRGRDQCFNSRPREGGDLRHCRNTRWISSVSIHAPAKGATSAQRNHRCQRTVSIHAPAKGATVFAFVGREDSGVSIHAPAKGATAKYYK